MKKKNEFTDMKKMFTVETDYENFKLLFFNFVNEKFESDAITSHPYMLLHFHDLLSNFLFHHRHFWICNNIYNNIFEVGTRFVIGADNLLAWGRLHVLKIRRVTA